MLFSDSCLPVFDGVELSYNVIQVSCITPLRLSVGCSSILREVCCGHESSPQLLRLTGESPQPQHEMRFTLAVTMSEELSS